MTGSRLRLRRRVQLLAAAFVALIGLNLLAAVRLTVVRDQTASTVDKRLLPARQEVANLLNALISQETGQRGYIITGRPQQLDVYLAGQAAVDRSTLALRRLLAGRPELLDELARAEQAVFLWQEQVAEPEIAARRSGRPGDAEALVAAEETLRLFEKATGAIEELRRGVNAELADAEESRDQARTLLTRVLVVSLLAGIGLLVLARHLVRKWITDPLDELARSVAQVAGGDLEHEIEPVGPPELEELGAGVEAMRRRIVTELDDADRARSALARRGLVVRNLRDELAPTGDPLPDTWHLATRFDPAEGILAGDWFDVLRVSPERLAVVVVDVAGHGASTGVFALRTKQLVLAGLRSGLPPGRMWQWVHRQLGDTGDLFLTGACAVIDATSGAFAFASAGHPDVLLLRGEGPIEHLEATGPLLGPFDGTWDTVTGTVHHGDMLVACTDGLLEVRDENLEEWGVDGLARAVETMAGRGIEEVADAAMAASRAHGNGRSLDDLTLVVLGRR